MSVNSAFFGLTNLKDIRFEEKSRNATMLVIISLTVTLAGRTLGPNHSRAAVFRISRYREVNAVRRVYCEFLHAGVDSLKVDRFLVSEKGSVIYVK